MITNLESVTVYVNDQDQALDFYVNKLGFEKRADNPMGPGMRWVTVAPPGGKTEIVLASIKHQASVPLVGRPGFEPGTKSL